MPEDKSLIKIKDKTFTREQFTKITNHLLKKEDLSHKEKLGLIKYNQQDLASKLRIIKRVQRHTYEHIFKKHPKDFHTSRFHYDWWMFPMCVPTAWQWPQRNYDCSLSPAEVVTLLNDDEFLGIYCLSVEDYINALVTYGWNDYPVRFARVLHSLALFVEAANNQEQVIKPLDAIATLTLDYAGTIRARYSKYNLFETGLERLEQQAYYSKEICRSLSHK